MKEWEAGMKVKVMEKQRKDREAAKAKHEHQMATNPLYKKNYELRVKEREERFAAKEAARSGDSTGKLSTPRTARTRAGNGIRERASCQVFSQATNFSIPLRSKAIKSCAATKKWVSMRTLATLSNLRMETSGRGASTSPCRCC